MYISAVKVLCDAPRSRLEIDEEECNLKLKLEACESRNGFSGQLFLGREL